MSRHHRRLAPAVGLALLASAIVGARDVARPAVEPGASPTPPVPAAPPTWALVNGRWFDGEDFVERTAYAVNGLLTERAPEAVDSTLDLTGLRVVPPFGEAHNHNVEVEQARPLTQRPETV